MSMVSLIISYAVCTFLFLEATQPAIPAAVFGVLFLWSAAGTVCAVIGAKRDGSPLSAAALVISGTTTAAALITFLIMLSE